jgi:hypothetical protein
MKYSTEKYLIRRVTFRIVIQKHKPHPDDHAIDLFSYRHRTRIELKHCSSAGRD